MDAPPDLPLPVGADASLAAGISPFRSGLTDRVIERCDLGV